MSPKATAILIIVFAVILSLNVLGVFDFPNKENISFKPTITPSLGPSPTQTKIAMPKFTLAPIKTPQRTPLTLRPSPAATPSRASQPTQIPSSSVFENFDPSSFEQVSTALDQFGKTPFGGKVLYTQDCDPLLCSGANQLVGIGPPKGGIFAETGSTILYREYDISVGNWVLGLAGSLKVCWNFVCVFDGCICIPIGAGPEIEMIGTSE